MGVQSEVGYGPTQFEHQIITLVENTTHLMKLGTKNWPREASTDLLILYLEFVFSSQASEWKNNVSRNKDVNQSIWDK